MAEPAHPVASPQNSDWSVNNFVMVICEKLLFHIVKVQLKFSVQTMI